MAQTRIVEGEYQFRVNANGQGMQKSDSFIFRITTSGLKLLGLMNGIVLDVMTFPFEDRSVLEVMFNQKVMRFELVQDDGEIVVLLALNSRFVR